MKYILILISLLLFTLVVSAQVDLTKSRIVVTTGTSHDQYATTHYPHSQIVRVENHVDLIPMLIADKANYGIIDLSFLKTLTEKDNRIVIVDSALYSVPNAVAFRLKDKELLSQFNDYLRQIRDNGIYQQVVSRWMDQVNPILPDIKTKGKKIRVATSSSVFPYSYIEENKLVGYDIEIMLRFGQSKGYEIVFEDMNFGAMIAALVSNKVDIVAAGLSITEERKKQVAFSEPYIEEPTAVFAVDKKRRQKFVMPKIVGGTIEDTIRTVIGQDRISVVEGTVQEIFLSKTFPHAQIVATDDQADAFLMLNSGNADYVFCSIGVASEYIRNNPNTEMVLSHLMPSSTCFAVGKSNTVLRDELNNFIAKTDIASLYKYWFANLSDGKMPEINLSENTQVLRVGSSANLTPFNFVVGNEYRGLEFDILMRFCQATGRRMEITQVPFNTLMALLTTDKVDVLAGALACTEERAKTVNFTNSYMDNYSVILRNTESEEVTSKGIWDTFKDAFYNNIVAEKRYLLILDGLRETIILAIFSMLLGILIGGSVCYLRMRNNIYLSILGKVYVDVMRGIPVLVLLMMNYYVFFAQLPISATWVAVISFAMNFGAYVSEMFRSSIGSIDKGQREAGIAMGFTSVQTFIYIIAPQAIARVLPVFKGEAISLVKMTSIVGYIAVQDLTKASDIIRSRTFDAFFPLILVAILYFLLSYVFAKLLDLITSKYIKQ